MSLLIATCPGPYFVELLLGFVIGLPLAVVGTVVGIVKVAKACSARTAARRRAQGLCGGCGYDLRLTALPGGPRLPRCPECGTLIDLRPDR